jgi:RNA exonuclease 4
MKSILEKVLEEKEKPNKDWFIEDMDKKDLEKVYPNKQPNKNQIVKDPTKVGKYLAIDCEMVGVGPKGNESALARVSIVNYHGHVILDRIVKPKERITDYRTFVSGITPEMMKDAISFEKVQKEVADLIKDRILIGHAIHHDLKVGY